MWKKLNYDQQLTKPCNNSVTAEMSVHLCLFRLNKLASVLIYTIHNMHVIIAAAVLHVFLSASPWARTPLVILIHKAHSMP